ncbi:MAG: heme-degrading domain-containing protein [Roseiarcus sp.]|jgi:uncharacterized protein (UPF0303 family)
MEASVALQEDVRRLAEQERLLVFSRFGPEEAWALGNIVREVAVAHGAPIAIDVSLRDRTLFHCALPGSTTDNAEWIRRKRNTVLRLWRSSYRVGRSLALSGETQEAAHALPLADYAVHGGGFPLLLQGVGCIGAITVSGLPQRDDHTLASDGLAALLKVDLSACRLAAEPA